MLPYRKWFTRDSVKRLVFNRGDNAVLGGGYGGVVYEGRLYLNDGRRKHVSVKEFHTPLDESKVKVLESIIRKLVIKGVRVPKTGYVFHSGKWLQVKQLFGTPRNKTFVSIHPLEDRFGSREEAIDAAEQLAGVINAGFRFASDSKAYLYKKNNRRTSYIFDLGAFTIPEMRITNPITRFKEVRECADLLRNLAHTSEDDWRTDALTAFANALEDKRAAERIKQVHGL